MEINNAVYRGDCLEGLRKLDDNSVDLAITSPPYAMQRKNVYGGVSEEDYADWMLEVVREIKRVLKPSGSFVLNIKEHVRNGERSTYVLETVLKAASVLRWTDTYSFICILTGR